MKFFKLCFIYCLLGLSYAMILFTTLTGKASCEEVYLNTTAVLGVGVWLHKGRWLYVLVTAGFLFCFSFIFRQNEMAIIFADILHLMQLLFSLNLCRLMLHVIKKRHGQKDIADSISS